MFRVRLLVRLSTLRLGAAVKLFPETGGPFHATLSVISNNPFMSSHLTAKQMLSFSAVMV